ncbi:hypothetical protein ABLN97_11440 [Mycobacterium tuberculosis]
MAKTVSWCRTKLLAMPRRLLQLGPFTEAITQVFVPSRSTLRLRRQMAKAIGDAARPVGRGRPG